MPDTTKRLQPSILKADADSNDAVQSFTDYAPSNLKFTKVKLTEAKTLMTTTRVEEVRLQGLADGARDTATAAEWAFHQAVLGAKDQVSAQYGDDSDQVQAVGLTKKSERKKPVRREPTTPPPPGP